MGSGETYIKKQTADRISVSVGPYFMMPELSVAPHFL
jgi:hypothetical protein